MIPHHTKVGLVRTIAAIVLAIGVTAGLASCADIPAQVQGCVTPYAAGSASKSISAPGAIGTAPKVHIPTPSIATRPEVSVLKKGNGLLLGKGDIAQVSAILFNGSTGAIVGATNQTLKFARATATQIPVGDVSTVLPITITRAIECQRVGSRIAVVLSAAEAYGTAASAKSQGLTATQTMVLVTDIGAGYRGRATGILQPLQSGFPSVVTSGNGTPGLTLDLQEPPKVPTHEVVRGGSGAVVKAGQKVLLQVQAIAWTDPAPTTTFDSTWTDNTPRFYTLTALTANKAGYSLDAPSVRALVGQKVGSQVLVVVPPKYGYPSGKEPSGYPTKETLVYVYDILGIY